MGLFCLKELLLCFCNNLFEHCRLMDSHFAEHLAVERNLLQRKLVHELTIGHTLRSDCSTDTRDPQTSEIPFLSSAMRVRMHARFHDTCLRLRVETA